LKGVRLGVIGR